MTALTLPGMPEPPPPAPPGPQRSAGQRLTERQAADVRGGRHPLTGGPLHPQADQGARAGDSGRLPYRCGSCIHRILEKHNDYTFPKCERFDITHGQASDCRGWWPACPQWEDTL